MYSKAISTLLLTFFLPIIWAAPLLADSFSRTPQGFWDWVEYVQSNWTYESDRPGELCQPAGTSQSRLRGDCDDFAVMIACYAQEYWSYDSYCVGLYNTSRQARHMVAFIHVDYSVITSLSNRCSEIQSQYPYRYRTQRLRDDSISTRYYIPIDWQVCPGWIWTSTEPNSRQWEWYELEGKAI